MGKVIVATVEWLELEGIMATTHKIEKYGGFQLDEDALQRMAEALNSGRVPLLGQHDWGKPVRTQQMSARIIRRPDGESELRISVLVHAEDWDSAGEIGGMSFSVFEPIGRADGPHKDADPLRLGGDAAWFDDETISAACVVMSALAPVEGSRLYQFSAVHDLKVVLDLGYDLVQALGPSLAASAIYDGVKLMLRSVIGRRDDLVAVPTTRIELSTTLPSGSVVALIDTPDSETARRALETYSRALAAAARVAPAPERQVLMWNPSRGGGAWETGGRDLGSQDWKQEADRPGD